MTVLTDTPLWLDGEEAPESHSVMESPQWWNSSGWDGRAVSTTSAEIDSGRRGVGIGTRFVDLGPGGPPAACQNGVDDDGDGQIDGDDPGCDSFSDPEETDASLPCDDGIDNDGDGFADSPPDPGCEGPASPRENPQCQDGVDNDGDGGIDFDGGASLNGGTPFAWPDAHCSGASDERERQAACGLGFGLAVLPLLLLLAKRRVARNTSST
jgi:hypothetical protein